MTAADGYAPGAGNPFWPPWRSLSWIEQGFERARASGKPEDDTRLRIFFVLALFLAGFLTLSLGATKAALLSGLEPGADASLLPPNARADLVDRNGQILATDLVHYGLYIAPNEVSEPAATRAALLAALPMISPARLDRALKGDHGQFYVIGGLAPEMKVKVHDLALPGIYFQDETARAYPLGETGAHIIGFAGKDGSGLAGAERGFNKQIRDGAGRGPVALSIDLRVQGALQDELNAAADKFQIAGGSGIVVNVHTGEILALASYPAFDPNHPGTANAAAMIDHPAATVYEPGSVFKVFTLAMGLDSGVATVDTPFDVHTPLVLPGQTIHDFDKGDSVLPLWEVFTHSSNIGAARLGLLAGAQRMDSYFRNFGLFAPAPSELVESAHPILARKLSENIVATMAFGHAISVTPLALATGMSAILDGGVYRPLTLKKLEPGQAPAAGRRVIKASTSRTMLNLMRLNATSGTGRKADVPGYRVGGKTGTATKIVNGRYDKALNVSSFAGIFPTDGPLEEDRYYVLIMLDSPHATPDTGGFTTGGVTAAPTVGKIIARIGPLLGVQRIILPAEVGPKPAIDPGSLTGGER